MSISGPHDQKPVKVTTFNQQVESGETYFTLGINSAHAEVEALPFNLDDKTLNDLSPLSFVLGRKKLLQILGKESWQITSPWLKASASSFAFYNIISALTFCYCNTSHQATQVNTRYIIPLTATLSAIAKMLAQHQYQGFLSAQNLWKSTTDGMILAAFLLYPSFDILPLTYLNYLPSGKTLILINETRKWSIISACLVLGSFKSLHTYFKNHCLRQEQERLHYEQEKQLQHQNPDYVQLIQDITHFLADLPPAQQDYQDQINQLINKFNAFLEQEQPLALIQTIITTHPQAKAHIHHLLSQIKSKYSQHPQLIQEINVLIDVQLAHITAQQKLADHCLATLSTKQADYQALINQFINEFNIFLDKERPLELIPAPIPTLTQAKAHIERLLSQIHFSYTKPLQLIQEINALINKQLARRKARCQFIDQCLSTLAPNQENYQDNINYFINKLNVLLSKTPPLALIQAPITSTQAPGHIHHLLSQIKSRYAQRPQLIQEMDVLIDVQLAHIAAHRKLIDQCLATLATDQKDHRDRINWLIHEFNVFLDKDKPPEPVQIPIPTHTQAQVHIERLLSQIHSRYTQPLQLIQKMNALIKKQLAQREARHEFIEHCLNQMVPDQNYQDDINYLIKQFNAFVKDQSLEMTPIQTPVITSAQAFEHIDYLLSQINGVIDKRLASLQFDPNKMLRLTHNIFYRLVNHAICQRALTCLEGAAVFYSLIRSIEFLSGNFSKTAQIIRYTGSGIGGLIHTLMMSTHHLEKNRYYSWYENIFEGLEGTAFSLAAYYAFFSEDAGHWWEKENRGEQTYFWSVALPLFIIMMQLFSHTRKIQQNAHHNSSFTHSLSSYLQVLYNDLDEEENDEKMDNEIPLIPTEHLFKSDDYSLQLTSSSEEDSDMEISQTYLPSRHTFQRLKEEDDAHFSHSFSKLSLTSN